MVPRERRCETCRWWDVHSLDLKKGDCRVTADKGMPQHRYSRVPMPEKDGTMHYAYLDSFGPEETGPHFVCGRWERGETEPLSKE